MSYDLYTSKDVAKILGINANKLFHWVQTKQLFVPSIRGIGRGKKNYFSLEDMATLAVVKVLVGFGMELWCIKELIDNVVSHKPLIVAEVKNEDNLLIFYDNKGEIIPAPYAGDAINIWQIYKKGKDLFEKNGLILAIYSSLDGAERFPRLSFDRDSKIFYSDQKFPGFISILAINLRAIVKEIEKRTGLAL